MKTTNDNKTFNILVINPGSTSTKVSLFQNRTLIHEESIAHSQEELAGYRDLHEQRDMRLDTIRKFLQIHSIDTLDAVIGRGGLLHPLVGGVYLVNQDMLKDLKENRYGEHASNLGAILADEFALAYSAKAYIADPVVIDEMEAEMHLSGLPEMPRKSAFHALNQKAAARKASSKLGKSYDELNLIVAHMGGGISVGAHRRGKVIDVNNALDGDGPFSPERTGTLPIGELVKLCFSGTKTLEEVKKLIVGQGGMVAYCGTNNLLDLETMRAKGDSMAETVFKAMVHQISKEIASHGATLHGHVDAVVLTGGMANDVSLVKGIKDRISFLGRVIVIPGEMEMEALAENAFMALSNKRKVLEYVREN